MHKNFFDPASVPVSWHAFFIQHKELLDSILRHIEDTDFTPQADRLFRFTEIPLPSVRVVILGQDPYPQPGVATGRSFEVGGLDSWLSPFPQASVRNIVRAVYLAYTGECLPWRLVREKIASGAFPLPPPSRWFDCLAAQGVLLLNASLSCRIGHPGSHRDLWLPFTRSLISHISESRPDACWFLWGKDAAAFLPQITGGEIYTSRHPMLCGTQHPEDFLKSPCFIRTMDRIDWCGSAPTFFVS